ncbi:MAG: aminoglycoside phosphotransferase family protein [Tepidiformaceae bacterium]
MPTPGKRLGVGRAAEVFEWGSDAVIKVLLQEGPLSLLDAEASSQRAASEAGLPVPRIRDTLLIEGRPSLVMDRVHGVDGLAAVEAQPWRLWTIGRDIGQLHRRLNEVQAPAGLPRVADVIGTALDRPEVPKRARGRLRALLDTMPGGDRLCHGDFHPGNVIQSLEGPVVIDLANACSGEPTVDYVRAQLLFAVGTPGGDISWRDRMLIAVGRGAMSAAYRSGYRSQGPIDDGLARRWKPLVVASRLTEGFPEERVVLLRMLSRSLREAEQSS